MTPNRRRGPGPGWLGTMTELISAVEAVGGRFPTSLALDGSGAMNPEPDYSAAYVTTRTSGVDKGHGLAFTVGRGNDDEVAAVRALAPLVVGLPVEEVLGDRGSSSRRAGKPVGRLLSEPAPEQLVGLVDFRYLEEALTRDDNAGIGAQGTIEDNPDDEWCRVFDANVFGMVRAPRTGLPHLRRFRSAAIVNTCSIAATAVLPDRTVYSATKGAVLSLTRASTAGLLRSGSRVD